MLYPSMRRISSDTARTVSRVIDSVNASCGRSHGSQHCAVSAKRAESDWFAPPPCHSVPRKKTQDPAAITTGVRSASFGVLPPQRWLPVDIDPDSAGAFVIGGIRHGIAQQLRVTPLPDPGIVTARLWRLISAALGVA